MFVTSPQVAQAGPFRSSRLPASQDCPWDLSEALSPSFQSTGGLASGEEVALLLRRHCNQPLSQLARWIVGREIVNFEWRSQTLIPLFQFDLDQMSIKPEVAAVILELAPNLDAWQLASWFAASNVWLGGAAPVDHIGRDFPAVLEAARTARFVSTGASA